MDHYEKATRQKNPRETANLFSKLTFLYTARLFGKDLEERNIYEVLKCFQSKKCGDKLEKAWATENTLENTSPSIYRLLWRRFGWRYLLIGFVDLAYKIFHTIMEPLAISKLTSYFTPSQTEISRHDAYLYAVLVLFLNVFYAIYTHNCLLWAKQLGIEIKTAFSSLLYRKALKLTPSALANISLGNLATLITKDVYTFEVAIWMFNDIWSGLMQTCVICYLLYIKIGPVSFLGIGVILSAMPLLVFLGRWISRLRLVTGKMTDERLQKSQEAFSFIRIIKMYTWEKFFIENINQIRKKEMKKLLMSSYLAVCLIIVGILFSRLGLYSLVISYIWMGYSVNTELMFYIIALFKELEYNLGGLIPYSMGRAAEVYSALTRINTVLTAEELPSKSSSKAATSGPIVEVRGANVNIGNSLILEDITFRTTAGLTLVTGSVGSGKSSLLKTLLQDYPLSSGYLMTSGRISYASQDPWLFPSTIRQNILFGENLNEKRYQEVIRVCALQYDLNLFDNGDETIVSDRGLNLSKGQQARINLARAIYKDSEIYLLDDSLTALDSQVQDHIFNECIKTFLKNKICIMVTQNVKHMQEADVVVTMEHGRIQSCGKPDVKILEKINEMISNDTDSDQETETKDTTDGEERNEIEETPLLETEQNAAKNIYNEMKKKGRVDFENYKKYVMFGGGAFLVVLNLLLFAVGQFSDSYSSRLLAHWVDEQQHVIDLQNATLEMNDTGNNTTIPLKNDTSSLSEALRESQFTITFYSVTLLISAVFQSFKAFAIFNFCRKASVNVHKTMINSVMNAVMAYFDTHLLGNILNRFSQDMNNIDEQLSYNLSEILRSTFSALGIVVLIVIVNKRFLIYAGIIFIFLMILRRLYLPTGRSLKRLSSSTRSPIMGHLNASLEGLTTIRAYGVQDILKDEFDRHTDLFTSTHYMTQCATRAFGFSMNIVCTLLICMVIVTFIFFDTDTSAGDVGLALTQVLYLSDEVQWGVRVWADLESLMTSVERVMEYTEIKPEIKEGQEIANWPNKGAVTYENVSLTYNDNEIVLKNLNFKIEPHEKIGIVGRTGAGKSSIIASIFRLYESEGTILIDDVDIKTVSLKLLRKKLAIIPQDPVLFSGTIRTNLDPFREFEDEHLWKILKKVNLHGVVPSLSLEVRGNSSNFSSGQRQLICLARAILRESKIIILDEATANMDQETDSLLYSIIEENFSDCTVITISHRITTILKCDRVLVMDRGEVKQYDTPSNLLENEDGIFYGLVKQAGSLDYLS
nr:probable multidrug resistance-associated protein lethal(2)03659 [Leptinotarsa decemlineata]